MFSFSINKTGFLLVAFCSLLSLCTVHADEIPDSTKIYPINEVTVKGQYNNAETRSSTPLQILSANQINQMNVLQVSDVVKYFSGVTVKDYGGIGGLKTLSVRSLGAEHTAVSYDGITVTDCQTGQIDIGRFSLDDIELLSLNNGQSDNIFQPARLFASAAVLNIRTLTPQFQPDKSFKGKLRFKSGSFGLVNPSLLLQKKLNDHFSLSLSGEWLSANGEYPYLLQYGTSGDSTSMEKRKNTDVKNMRLEGTLYASLSEHSNGYLKVYYYNSDRGLPGATVFYNMKNFSSQRLHDNTFFIQAHYQNDFSKKLAFQVNAKVNHDYLHYKDTTYLNNIGMMESVYRQNEYYTSASALYRAFPSLSFAVSTDGFINNLDATYETDSLNNAFAKPVRYNWLTDLAAKYVSEHFIANGGALLSLIKDEVQKGTAGSNQQKLSPFVSFSFKPFEKQNFRIRGLYKNIISMPTFNDLYYARVGNTNLRPEQTDQLNLGITYALTSKDKWPGISVTIDGYHNMVKDKIVAVPTQNLFVWSMVNIGKVRIDGVDFTAEATVPLAKDISLLLGGTYTYQRALDVTTPGSNTYLNQIPYTPRICGSGRAMLETPWVNIAYSIIWSGHRYSGFQNYVENRLPGYSDQSISASKSINIQNHLFDIRLEVLNLMNENYSVIRWFPMPGRSFRLALTYTM